MKMAKWTKVLSSPLEEGQTKEYVLQTAFCSMFGGLMTDLEFATNRLVKENLDFIVRETF